MRYFCPSCWTEIDAAPRRCPACGADLNRFHELSYEDKLLLALRHPVLEHRLMAIVILGRRRSERAVPFLRALLDSEDNVYVVREALRALARIGGPGAQAVLQAATSHQARLVRDLAKELLASHRPPPEAADGYHR
jgi:HEAT repeat protein